MWQRALAILLVVSVTVSVVVNYSRQEYNLAGPLAQVKDVVVPHGTPEQVAYTLVDAGVVRDAWKLRIAALVTRGQGPIHAGEFEFPVGGSLRDVLAILRAAKPVAHHLTIPEGLTAAQIAQLLDRAPALIGDTPLPAEGEMLPETYAYEYGATRASLVARAKAAMDRTLAQAWASRAPDLPLADAQAMLTLASIVERETSKDDERPHVAAVFLNRLRQGMKLQSDPTVIYAASGGLGALGRPLTRADLDLANPYNTYQAAALPPGPIDSPGVKSLQAVAHPAASDDLYFVADGTGGHAFAKTLDEHNKNVARWRALNAPPTVR